MENKKIRAIYNVFDQVNDSLAKQTVQHDSNKLNELLEKIYSAGPSFQYVFDFPNKKFLYVSTGAKTLFGVNPATFLPQEFVDRIHPDDISHYAYIQELVAYFLFEHIYKNEIPKYKVSFQFRIKDIEENYRLFLHQAIALSVDESYNLFAVFANHSIIDHITKVNNNAVSFLHIDQGKSYFGITRKEDLYHEPSKLSISNREIEILKLISEGFTSRDIANYLHISLDTVRTHRKNIINKTKCRNLTQAVAYYIREGLI